jgi:hypothetical protein
MGGGAEDNLLHRYARVADGWLPLVVPGTDIPAAIGKLRGFLQDEGRDPGSFGLDLRVNIDNGGPKDWAETARRWKDLGATNLAVMSPGRGVPPMENLQRLSEARRAVAEQVGE